LSRSFRENMDKLRAEFEGVPRGSFTLDGWTSPFQTSFLGITAHWLSDDWELKDVTIGFEHLKRAHTAEVLNGSNVLKLAKAFEAHTRANLEWRPFDAKKQHVPDRAHVISLVPPACWKSQSTETRIERLN
ncbi:hypothetical protein BGZ94_005737, partial [Podila epigama]